MTQEVLDLIFEFLLSCLVIAGGGCLMLIGRGDSSFITSMIALVIYFWFQSRSNTATVNTLLKQFPLSTTTTPLPTTTVTTGATTTTTTTPTDAPASPVGNNI